MRVGDLVTWRASLPFKWDGGYGVVVSIIDEYLVGVVWTNSLTVYQEPIEHLEVVGESRRFS